MAVAASLLLVACSGGDDSTPDSSSAGANTTPTADTTDTGAGTAAEPHTDSAEAPTNAAASEATEAMVQLRATPQYNILETATGQTIYGILFDVANEAPQCPTEGPEVCESLEALLSPSGATLPLGLDASRFTLLEVAEGHQLMYVADGSSWGIPLYTWADEGPGTYDGLDGIFTPYVVTEEGKYGNSFERPDL